MALPTRGSLSSLKALIATLSLCDARTSQLPLATTILTELSDPRVMEGTLGPEHATRGAETTNRTSGTWCLVSNRVSQNTNAERMYADMRGLDHSRVAFESEVTLCDFVALL